jgi:lipopolysaccharide export system protein LptA
MHARLSRRCKRAAHEHQSVIRRLLALGALALPCIPAAAQDTQRCIFENTPNTRQLMVKLPSGQYNTFLGAGVNGRCPAKSVTLSADSLESYADEGRIFLVGHVRYDEPRLSLTSNYLTYYQKEERVVANGDVNARLPSGSTLKGPFAEYLRAIPGTRPNARIMANGRPAITIVQKDSSGKPTEPVTVVANNVTMEGDSLVYAGGSVLVTRQEVLARGDSMALDSEREITVMMRNPSIQGRRERPFTLSGERIELMSRNRKLQRVLSKGKATAVSEDMTLSSDTIDLRITADLLQRAIAWGPTRARATSPAQRIVSDSIDVSMPNQRIREMHAVRTALAEGRPDSTRFRADTLDWMRGDTIVARFDTVPTRDTSRAARMKEIVALGNAKSYYHLAPGDSTADKFAINYVIGRLITVAFQDQRVAKVTVIDQAAGVYLEPKPKAASADTARASPTSPTSPAPRPGATPGVRPATSAPPKRPPQ